LDGKHDGRETEDAGKQPSFLLPTPFVLLLLLSLLWQRSSSRVQEDACLGKDQIANHI